MRQIVLDTETTGLSAAQGDRIIEIGCIELIARKPSGNNRHFYLNPERDIHAEAQRVHGITRAFLADKPTFDQVAPNLRAYLAGAELIIHNAPFDLGFLDAEWQRLGLEPTRTWVQSVIDTLLMAKARFPGKRNGLDALCERLGVDNSGRTLHGALLDAELLAEVYVRLTRGQDALLIEPTAAGGQGIGQGSQQVSSAPLDASRYALQVLRASAAELQAHAELLAELDQVSLGRAIWYRYPAASAAPTGTETGL